MLDESIHYLYRQFLAHMEKHTGESGIMLQIQTCQLSDLYLITPKYLNPYLSYISQNRRLFRIAIENSATLQMEEAFQKMYGHIFAPIMERCQVPEAERSYLIAFYIQGLMAIIMQWLKNDCQDPEEQIIRFMQRCVPPFGQ